MTPTKPPMPARPDEGRKRGPETVIHARKQAQRLAVGMAVVSVGVCAFTVWSVTHRRAAAPTVAIHTEHSRPRDRAPASESTEAPPVAAAPSAPAATPPSTVAPNAPAAPAATPAPSKSVVAAAPDASSAGSSGIRLTLTSAAIRVDAAPSGAAAGASGSPVPSDTTASPAASAPSSTAPAPRVDSSETAPSANAPGDTAPAIATVLGAVELELARAEARGDDALVGRLEQQRTELLKRLRDAVRASENAAAPTAPPGATAPP